MNLEPEAGLRRPMSMVYRFVMLLAAATLVAFAIEPGHATSNYEYDKHEYALIRDGLAPNKLMSLASHGNGELGDEDFHVWLMSEPNHRRIMALPDISSHNNLDTAPDAYHAFWSADARHVAVAFRTDRHEIALKLYSIEGRRPRPIGTPNLFKEVTSRDVADRDDRHELILGIEWRRGNRILLREYQTFTVSDPAFLRLLGAYGRVKEKLDDGKLYVEFAAEADCILEGDHHYRVIDLRPADPDHPPDW
jgi:hypothetical protein